ncbi:MAG: hypothetical protein AAF203_06215 [Pseudomonadota bacterium]
MSKDNVIYLKDYIKGEDGSLENKIVVGSDIRPGQAVNLAVMHCPLQIVTNGFDVNRIKNIKDDLHGFIDNPVQGLLGQEDEVEHRFKQKFFGLSKKSDFLVLVEQFLKQSYFRKVREDVYLIADELFTNFSKSAKNDQTSMTFGIEANSDSVVIYCQDPCGGLDPKDMLMNIQRCFQQGVKNAIKKEEVNGAGIGSYLIYTLGVGMVISVQEQKNTSVVIWMPRKMHHEDRVDMNKSLIVIESKGA